MKLENGKVGFRLLMHALAMRHPFYLFVNGRTMKGYFDAALVHPKLQSYKIM